MVRPEDYGIELCGGGSSARASILPEGITDNFGLGAQGDNCAHRSRVLLVDGKRRADLEVNGSSSKLRR